MCELGVGLQVILPNSQPKAEELFLPRAATVGGNCLATHSPSGRAVAGFLKISLLRAGGEEASQLVLSDHLSFNCFV